MGYILKEDVVRRCEAVKAIAEKQIKEWREHTLEYKEQVNCQEAFDREREMRDILMFLEDLPDENVREDIQAYWIVHSDKEGGIAKCSYCNYSYFMGAPWHEYPPKFCPGCGARMIKESLI